MLGPVDKYIVLKKAYTLSVIFDTLEKVVDIEVVKTSIVSLVF